MKRIIIILVGIIIIVLGACNDEEFLENTARDSNDRTDAWANIQDLENIVIGGYYMTSGTVYSENQYALSTFARDLPTDICHVWPKGSGLYIYPSEAKNFYERDNTNPRNGALVSIWGSCYSVIANCNEGIDFINNQEEKFDDPNNWYPRLVGELHFLRALNYWYLAKTFAPPYSQDNLNKKGIIMRTEPTEGFGDANKGLGSVEELYQLISDDLDKAIENLPNEPRAGDPDQYNYSRVTKPAAKFMKARLMFEMQQWDKAKTLATEVINDDRFTLEEDPIEAWNKVWYERPNEVLWYYQWVHGDGVGHEGSDWKFPKPWNSWNAHGTYWGMSGDLNNPYKFISSSYSFLDQVGWIDEDKNETPDALNDLRYLQLYFRWEEIGDTTKPQSEYVIKVPIHGGSDTILHHVAPDTILEFEQPTVWCDKYYRNQEFPRTVNQPMLRLPEMYLIRAIVSFRGENGANQDIGEARRDINQIRQRAGLNPISGKLTEQDIMNELMKEFAFEGARLWFLQALRKDIPGGDRENGTISWNSPNLIFPVPQGERDDNTAID
jgi:hypothetical protein